jgi:hypothetical protein
MICRMLQGCLRMITTALQQLTIFVARLVVQVYRGERVVERCALVTQAKIYWFHSQAKRSTWGRRLERSASRRPPHLLAIPVFDRRAGLSDRHLTSNRAICLR